MRASVIQIEAGADKQANILAARALMTQAIEADHPDLISLPEMWSCLGGDRATKLAQSEMLPAPGEASADPHAGSTRAAYDFLRDMAVRHSVTVHGGSIGEREGDQLFNTTIVFGPDGAELARYRKIHLFDVTTPTGQGFRESAIFGAGENIVTCETGGTAIGLAICYDLRFPELFLALRRRGADIIMIPSAFTAETGRDHWEVLLRARAIETQCWIAAAATTGHHRDAQGRLRETYGHSLICDPWGHIRAAIADGPGFATAEIDLDMARRVREAMPVLAHRRLA